MMNKTDYWLKMCDDDLDSAKYNLKGKKLLWVAFICHLVVEKSLKAVIASQTDKLPPKIHDLIKLAEKGNIIDDLSEAQYNFLDYMTKYQIEARYPEYKSMLAASLTYDKCKDIYKNTEELLCWIKLKLGK